MQYTNGTGHHPHHTNHSVSSRDSQQHVLGHRAAAPHSSMGMPVVRASNGNKRDNTGAQNAYRSGSNGKHIHSTGIGGPVHVSSLSGMHRSQVGESGRYYRTPTGEARPHQTRSGLSAPLQTTPSGSVILGEKVVEHNVKVPKRVIREDVVEKVVVVPERVIREDVVVDTVKVREKIVEVAKPIIHERIVEVPEIKYVDKIVEVVEKVVQEKIKEVPRTEYKERIVEVPKYVTKEKIVEVPEYEYQEVPVETIIEVPEIRENVVFKEVAVPQYVDKPVPEYQLVEVPEQVDHNVPVPLEAVTTYGYKLPMLTPKYSPVEITMYVPRFVEVPVPAEFMDEAHRQQAAHFSRQVDMLAQQKAASLAEAESLAGAIRQANFNSSIFAGGTQAGQLISGAWATGKMKVFEDNQNAAVGLEATHGPSKSKTRHQTSKAHGRHH